MDPKLLITEQFNQALVDYFFLIDKGYPEKGSLKLVGDRNRLLTEQRTLLYRGISSTDKSKKRSARILQKPTPPLIIDGYNVLFTLMNYRLGRFVFISTDAFCRDAGSLFGKNCSDSVFTECISLLITYLIQYINLQIIIYLDAPVSKSQIHSRMITELIKQQKLKAQVEVVHSADHSILLHTKGTIASSDSELIDNSNLSVIDIPFQILKEQFNANIFNLKDKLASLITSGT